MADTLFDTCPLPGCTGPTADPREPCADCVAKFGDYLRPPAPEAPRPDPGQYRELISERDQDVEAAYTRQLGPAGASPAPAPAVTAEEWTDGQCWVCERQRKCRPDPSWRDLPICRSCGREELA